MNTPKPFKHPTPPNPPKPQPNFNLIARPYRYLEYLTLGRALQRTRLHHLPVLLHQTRALVFGDGDGRFLARLLSQNPNLQADAVDTSSTMLHLLRQRCHTPTRLRTHHTSALDFTPTGPYDLVVTHFFLDCLSPSDLDTLIARTTPHLTPAALWLISDFRLPTGPLRPLARIFIRTLYLAFRILTGLRTHQLPDHATPLTHAGYTRIAHHQSLAGLLTTELWQSPTSNQN